AAPGDPRSPCAQDPEPGPAARLGHLAAHPAAVARGAGGEPGLALPRAPSPGGAGIPALRVAALGERPPRQVLPPERRGQEAARGRDAALARPEPRRAVDPGARLGAAHVRPHSLAEDARPRCPPPPLRGGAGPGAPLSPGHGDRGAGRQGPLPGGGTRDRAALLRPG